jgi:hypothetical protein
MRVAGGSANEISSNCDDPLDSRHPGTSKNRLGLGSAPGDLAVIRLRSLNNLVILKESFGKYLPAKQ